jgi:hypothetical protein
MTRKMYDSDRPSAIPTNAPMVAGYIDGSNPWSAADWARFPNAVKVRIARRAYTNDGHVLDVETGIVWPPALAVDWVLMRRKAGVDPTVYCNEVYGWPQVKSAFDARGVKYPHFWVSRYNSSTFEKASIPVGAVARQYANPETHKQGHWDESIVVDYWPGVDLGVKDMDWNETREYWNPAHNYSEVHPVGEVEGSNFYRVSDTYRTVEYIRSKLDILAGELSDDEINILSAFRSGVPAVLSHEQMDELKTAIREAQTDEQANAVVDAFWRRLAPGTATNPNVESPTV